MRIYRFNGRNRLVAAIPDVLILPGGLKKAEGVGRMNEAETMRLCGEDGIRRMVAGFYRRVRTDDLIGPMYPDDDWEGSELRLAEFVLFRLGASTRYTEMRGHPKLRARHAPFRIGIAERDRWLELMAAAMDEAALPEPACDFLKALFAQIADFMRNQAVPAAGGFRLNPLPGRPQGR